jgi:hypothetical protein
VAERPWKFESSRPHHYFRTVRRAEGDGGKMAARYEGVPLVQLLPDGRNIELKCELTFYDAQDIRWSVPPGAVLDGASIPVPFWSIIGSPLTGPYRDASIIHDWYCDVRTRPWEATHRVFYDAMMVSGVEPMRAKIMYFAVRWGGPRWEPRVSHNTGLDVGERYRFDDSGGAERGRRPRGVANPRDLAAPSDEGVVAGRAMAIIEAENPSLDKIERLAEDRTWQQ